MRNQYTKIRLLLFVLIGLLYSLHGFSQSVINKTATDRAAVDITSSEGYNFKIIDGEVSNDSTLAVIRKFNGKGYRIETAVYRKGSLSITYQFEYQNDTLLISMKTYKGPQKTFMQESLFKYDKNQNLKEQYEADKDNGPNLSTKNKYNKLGQRTKTTFRSMSRKISENKFKYDERGNKTERISCIPAKELFHYKYDDQDRLIQVHKVFKDGKKSLIQFFEYAPLKRTKHLLHDTRSWLGINGTIRLSHSDVLTKEETIGIANQIIEETEYLNGKLNGFRRYHYK